MLNKEHPEVWQETELGEDVSRTRLECYVKAFVISGFLFLKQRGMFWCIKSIGKLKYNLHKISVSQNEGILRLSLYPVATSQFDYLR